MPGPFDVVRSSLGSQHPDVDSHPQHQETFITKAEVAW